MIDSQRKLLFIHIARTGGTSIETALVGSDWWQIDPATKHLSASQTRKHFGEDVWRSHTKFSVIRNPWDRLVSMWITGWWYAEQTNFRGRKPSRLYDFIKKLRPHPHEVYDSLYYHEILDERIDFLLRFENLQDDFQSMLQKIGVTPVTLPHVEKRERGHYRDFYDPATKSLVEKLYRRDIKEFGYEF